MKMNRFQPRFYSEIQPFYYREILKKKRDWVPTDKKKPLSSVDFY